MYRFKKAKMVEADQLPYTTSGEREDRASERGRERERKKERVRDRAREGEFAML